MARHFSDLGRKVYDSSETTVRQFWWGSPGKNVDSRTRNPLFLLSLFGLFLLRAAQRRIAMSPAIGGR
jgi:hypothetical protein